MPSIHTRASRACFTCRNRKVRCNVALAGIPCSSCSSAGLKCSINPTKRSSLKSSAKERRSIPIGLHVFDVHMKSPNDQSSREADPESQSESQEDVTSRIDNFLTTAPEALDLDLVKALSATISDKAPVQSPEALQWPSVPEHLNSVAQNNDRIPVFDGSLDPELWRAQRPYQIQMPGYIQPVREGLDPTDVMFLEQKRAFSIPHRALQDELFLSYALYVHPLLPLLDLEDFAQAVNDNGQSNKISLILFQAVMFSAVPFVNIQLLETDGFDSREQARLKFFDKVRLLFDFNAELDPMTLIRSTILMTYWYDMPEDTKGRWYWLRIALSYANEIGLNRIAQQFDISSKQLRSRRRLWWCCYMRDRLISFTERRPCNTRDEDIDIPMLSTEDFETSFFTNLLQENIDITAASQVCILNELCIEKVRLTMLIGRVIQSLYVPRGHRRYPNAETKIVLVPRDSDFTGGDVIALDYELCQWIAQCCSNLKGLTNIAELQDCNIVRLHHGVLELVYHSVCSMVHRPQMCQPYVEDSASVTLQSFSRQRLRRSAQESTDIARRLMEEGLIERLAPIGITALLFAGMQHLNDCCGTTSIRSAATLLFDQTLQCLYRLRQVYGSARHAIGLLRIVYDSKAIGPFPSEKLSRSSPSQDHIGELRVDGTAYDVSSQGTSDDGGVKSPRQGASHLTRGFKTSSPRDQNAYWGVNFDWESVMNFYSPSDNWLSSDLTSN